jgi:hypothetical protein
MKYEGHITYHSTDMSNDQFLKSRSNFKVKIRRSRIKKGFVIRNTYMKYKSPITYHSKDMANVKVFEK